MRAILLLFATLLAMPVAADTVRVGALEFGTVNWELELIQDRGLAAAEGVQLQVLPLASKEAASVALQAGEVDVIVTDWLWVSRQRANGGDLTFVPHSVAVGGLMVPADSAITSVAALDDARLGIAGGPDDKSWLLLRAYALQEYGQDPMRQAQVSYAAPPLLNALIERGDLDAVLNYWHYNARLSAKGMRKLVEVEDMLPALGIARTPPLLGWAFSEAWAENNPEAIRGFLEASRKAKQILREDDDAWRQLRDVMNADSETEFRALRDAYREGIPEGYSRADVNAARRTFDVLKDIAGARIAGDQQQLAPGTFWREYAY